MTSISQERTKLATVGMRLRRREEWGARFDYTNTRSVTEPATRVFVHISVTNPSSYSSRDAHARAIEAIGISRFPSTGISYNRLIFAGTDTVYEGQPIGRRGAHTVNDLKVSSCLRFGSACPGYRASLTAPSWNLNYNSRAYVICQNIQHPVTEQMVDALARAIAADAKAGFVTEYAALHPHGHRCVSTKSCPGNLMWARMGLLKTKIAARLSEPSSGGTGSGGVPLPDPTVPEIDLDLLRKATDMILVKQAGTDPTRIWLLTGTSRRHVADFAAFTQLRAAGVPFDEKAEVSSQLLQWFPQAEGTLAEVRSVYPAP
jgi:hypothetical protein